MPTVAYTNNTTNTNGGVVDSIVGGCTDLFLDQEFPDANQFGAAQLSAGSAAAAVKNILLAVQGAVYDLPVGATINSATLYVNGQAGGFNTFDLSSHQLLKDFSKNESTWNTLSNVDSWQTAGGTGALDIGVQTDTNLINGGGWYSWDVQSIVQDFATNRGILGIALQATGGTGGFRFMDASDAGITDGVRWELIVDYTGGTAPTPPGTGPLIDFTGANGDPIPAELTAYAGTFDIQNNSLNCVTVGGGIGGIVGADVGTPDGTYRWQYVGTGSDGGDAVGGFIRAFDASNFIDLVQTGDTGAGLFQLVVVENDLPTSTLATYALPGYTNTDTIDIEMRLLWDVIEIDIDGNVNAIVVDTSVYHSETIFGGKYGTANQSRLDSWELPSSGAAPSIDSIVGTVAPGQTIEIVTSDMGIITGVTYGALTMTIDSATQDSTFITLPDQLPLERGINHTLEVDDGTDTADIEEVLNSRVGWGFVNRLGAAPVDSENMQDVCINQLGFTPIDGDQLIYTTQDNTSFDAPWVITSDTNTTGRFQVLRTTGALTDERLYFISTSGLSMAIENNNKRRRG